MPPQAAINSSVNALKKSAQQLSASPTQPAVIAQVPGQIGAVATSVQKFVSATSSTCG